MTRRNLIERLLALPLAAGLLGTAEAKAPEFDLDAAILEVVAKWQAKGYEVRAVVLHPDDVREFRSRQVTGYSNGEVEILYWGDPRGLGGIPVQVTGAAGRRRPNVVLENTWIAQELTENARRQLHSGPGEVIEYVPHPRHI